LPDYEAVVFDEAHGLEEVMTEHFGVDISTSRIDHLLRDWRNHLAKSPRGKRDMWMPNQSERLVGEVANVAQRFFADVRHRIAPLAQKNDGERFTLPEDLVDEGLQISWLALDTALEDLYAHGKHGSDCLRDPSGEAEYEELAEELRILAGRCQRFRDDLAAIADRKVGKGDYVFWGQARGLSVSLHASPVGVEEVLQRELLDKVRSLVFTSATLSAGGHFAHIRGRLGLGPDTTEELRVDSPFDYQKQCLLYLPRDIPDPRNPDELAARHTRIGDLLHLTDGHALVLFTSYRAMQECHKALAARAEFPIWMQGQAPRAALLELFRSTPRSVLLATSSFWEGIDVPGSALSHVLIDKLPFDVPSDPLNEARMARLELGGNSAFDHYQLPRAAIAFRQGFGRLIRRKCDRGIVTVLDPRIVTKRYGRFFLDSLPPVGRTSALEQVRRWWQEGQP
jgi:ATP-dependent DNA helicase DinG